VDERHVGATVKCGKCARTFTASATGPASRPFAAASPANPSATETDDDLPLDLDGPEAGAVEPGQRPSPVSLGDASAVPLGLGCLDVGVATSPGLIRPRNEDSYFVQQLRWSNLDQRREAAIVVVADGLGGHEAGDRASGLTIRTIGASLAPLFADALSDPKADLSAPRLSEAIRGALRDANRAVHAEAQKQAAWRGMGATVAAVLVVDGQAVVGHVGDCRVYHASAERLRQVTCDQTLVARMVELGQLSEEEALAHPSRNEVTHAVGRHPEISPALYEVNLATGDWLLVASDGMHAHVHRRELEAALSSPPASALALAHYLVRLADQGGGSDNCTVVAIRFC
jgi:protein phosphatase